MKRSLLSMLRLIVIGCVLMSGVSVGYADVIATIYPHIQPNPSLSPSWPTFSMAAITAIGNDVSSGGSGAAAYEVISQFSPGDIISSSTFHSWRGTVPGSYPNEHGNYLGFGLHVVGDGTDQFSLDGLAYSISSSDVGSGCPPGTSGTWCGVGGYATLDPFEVYNQFTIGINWGPDRVRGGGDDVIITAGASSQILDELIYVGGFGPGLIGLMTFDASGYPGATPQDQINSVISDISASNFAANIRYCMHYGMDGVTCADSQVGVLQGPGVIPEPASLLLLGTGLAGLVRWRRRKH